MSQKKFLVLSDGSPAVISILACCVVLRLFFFFTYSPWWSGDTGGYYGPAVDWLHWNLKSYDGARTPLYPAILFVTEWIFGPFKDDRISPLGSNVVCLLQALMGMAATCLFYFMARKVGFGRILALIVALVMAVMPQISQFERLLLPEATSLFFLIVSLWLFSSSLAGAMAGKTDRRLNMWAGLSAAAAILTRPNNIVFYIIFGGCMVAAALWYYLGGKKTAALNLVRVMRVIGLALAIPVMLWIAFNYVNTGRIALSNMSGLVRVFTAYNLFQYTPPEHKVLGGIMQKAFIDTHAAETKRRDYMWSVFGEINKRQDEMPFKKMPGYAPVIGVANYVGDVSRLLLIEHPDVWLANGLDNFKDTFDFSPLIPAEKPGDPQRVDGGSVIKNMAVYHAMPALSAPFSIAMLVCYILSWIALPLAAGRFLWSADKTTAWPHLFFFGVAASVMASMIAPCFLAAYYPRFAVPFYPVFILLAGYAVQSGWQFFEPLRAKLKT